MSSNRTEASIPPSFEAPFNDALAKYTQQTGKNLLDDPLAFKIDSCGSPQSFLAILLDQAKEFEEVKNGNPKLMNRLQSVVNDLHALSASAAAVTTSASLVSHDKFAVFLSISTTSFSSRSFLRQNRFFPQSASFSQWVSHVHLHLLP
jgi:hypothetical protein